MADNNSGIIVRSMVVGPIMTNCYCIRREDSAECIVVDPGFDGDGIYRALTEKGLSLKAILLTHAHFDHVSGLKALKDCTEAVVMASEKEKRLCQNPDMNLTSEIRRPSSVQVDRWLADNEILSVAGIELTVLSTPGHTEGSCCYYCEEGHFLISGDTMFYGSHGRTDFPTGDEREIYRSLQRLLKLPEETVVYPGHEAQTTIGRERKTWL